MVKSVGLNKDCSTMATIIGKWSSQLLVMIATCFSNSVNYL
ncbi:hypothetical protein Patl1_35402 [Pistacia atlantica]|nr:hypothetical protein Patl1_35402 [Pistacia atlantica]